MNNANTRLYTLFTILLGTITYSINCFNKVFQCSLTFVLLSLTTIIISELYGRKKALSAVALCVVVSFIVLWDFSYYIHSRIVNGVVIASFISILLSTYCSVSMLLRLKPAYSLGVRSFVSSMVGSVVDGIMMSGFLVNVFPVSVVFSIFYRETLFKCIYLLTACTCVSLGSFLVQKVYRSRELRSNTVT